jgi:exopolyphosphatase/guanosine-5'-triphosphate,3'-diphosphate pyrophosphatase
VDAIVHRMQVKYEAHLEHAHHVTRLALRLFDDLRELTGLRHPLDRRVLELAAELHDIGHFVHSKKHHLHSYHLIRSDRLLDDWTPELRLWVSVAALNHRKKKLRLEDLHPKHHDRARSLIALLRIADALDYEHDQRVQIARVEAVAGGKQVLLSLRRSF